MSTELIINASLPETRIALMEDGEIQDLLIERASGKGITGNIYKGRVTRVLPGMQAAFVDIGLEKAAFLYVDDVYVHSEIFEEEEAEKSAVSESAKALAEVTGEVQPQASDMPASVSSDSTEESNEEQDDDGEEEVPGDPNEDAEGSEDESPDEGEEDDEDDEDDEDEEDEDNDRGPVGMSAEGGDAGSGDDDSSSKRGDSPSQSSHPGTVAPASDSPQGESQQVGPIAGPTPVGQPPAGDRDARRRRGRRGGRSRSRHGKDRDETRPPSSGIGQTPGQSSGRNEGQLEDSQSSGAEQDYPSNFVAHVSDSGESSSDRAGLSAEAGFGGEPGPSGQPSEIRRPSVDRQAFKSQRSKDRRVPSRGSRRPARVHVNIQDILKEGQEVIVQVAKDPIATKGARLTCHISLPGRHLVCMPTIDHVGVSRRIDRDDERRKLRDIVENYRPRKLGFIVRTASGRGQAEKRIQQDIDYLANLWNEIREKAASVTAPAMVYEDLNSILRAIRDWVTEDIDKIIVDSRYHYNDILRFVANFMPSLKQKVELYHGDIPVFDAYKISSELSRALERKVWLKSGGYLIIDQAEALVAIDVNTGRYVGKKSLEDTILKTNLEAVQEIAYQLRLRNCGGIIILDLIDMEKEENRQRVYRALDEALKGDRARPSILKISELGLVEMTRKRTRDTMVRSLCESCSNCEGKGFIKSKVTIAYEVLREIEREVIERDVSKILIQAHPDVIDILAIDERETLDQIERRYRKQIYLQAAPDFHQEQFEVAGDKKLGKQAGDFSEVMQPLQGASSHERGQDRGNDRGSERGHGGGQDRDGGRKGRRGGRRDRGGRDRDRGGDRERPRQHTGPVPIGSSGPITQSEGYPEESFGDSPDTRPSEQSQDASSSGARKPREIRPPSLPIPRATPLERAPSFQNSAPNPSPNGQDRSGSENPDDSGAPSGNRAPGNQPGNQPRNQDDHFENEEDRVAFYRAQAAQDAALARLSHGGGGGTPAPGRSGGGGGDAAGGRDSYGDGGGGRGRRGRRGGRFQRGGGGGGGSRDFGNRGPRGNGGGGGSQGGPGGVGGGSQGPSTSGGGSAGGGGSQGGGSGGEGPASSGHGSGGDHSSPPTT